MNYNTFIEAEGTLAFQLSFLSKAVSTDETRPFMHNICIEESGEGLLGVATDGRRLHLVDPLDGAEVFGVTPGLWRVLKANGKTAWVAKLDDIAAYDKFPNWRKVMPDKEVLYSTVFEGIDRKRGSKSKELAYFIRDFPETTAFDLRYLADLGIGFDWTVEWYGQSASVKFTESNRTAVIMPMATG